ncbi:unnamed protein product, partial [Rotaria sordida]
MVRSARMQ